MIFIRFNRQFDFEYDIQGIIRSFYPGMELKSQTEGEKEDGYDFLLECDFDDTDMKLSFYDKEKLIDSESFKRIYTDSLYDRKETKNELKRKLYKILSGFTGSELPWGTLSGIRPTKITSKLVEDGLDDDKISEIMKNEYFLSDKKTETSIDISKREHKILDKVDYKNGYSLYIGIPFCPSTCLYCSFTSNPIGVFKKRIDDYIDALIKEIEFCSEAYKDRKLCSIYIGGGTPTSLSAEQLDRLLCNISRLYDTKSVYEFTVEAGRPDSITMDKLKAIKKYDVTRISINPQTMKDDTLKLIGRNHNTEEFLSAYNMARECGFDNINMDFILGLPNETIDDVKYNMKYVEKLKPNSLTIHSLAVKRAARLNLEQRMGKKYEITNTSEMMDVTEETAKKLGLHPYYLYRQKNMAGNLENVGYASEGKEGIYNILIMEEKQTILACGAGGSSKMVSADLNRIDRIENVKDVNMYIDNIDDMIDRKRRYIYGK